MWLEAVTPNAYWSAIAKWRKFSQCFTVIGWTDGVCESALDTTQTWYNFVDSLRKKLARRKFKSKNQRGNINNSTLDLGHSYDYPSQYQNPIINNVGVSQQQFSDEDHAWFQYYINTVSQQGWNVEPQLWQQLPEKVKNMVIEARREGMKKESSNILSPFSNKSTPLNNKNPNKFKETNSILREPQKHTNNPSTPNTNTPQRLPNQYTNNSTIANNILTGDNSINNATANLNVAIADTGEHIEKVMIQTLLLLI